MLRVVEACGNYCFQQEEGTMMDILYIAGTLLFFGLTWLFVKLCERV